MQKKYSKYRKNSLHSHAFVTHNAPIALTSISRRPPPVTRHPLLSILYNHI